MSTQLSQITTPSGRDLIIVKINGNRVGAVEYAAGRHRASMGGGILGYFDSPSDAILAIERKDREVRFGS